MMNGRNRPLFTASQYQELEHQALIFKYMISGMPIPPELLYPFRRNMEPITPRLFPHQPFGRGCFEMGYGRKVDPEPGRCRRTDGKKWRCSKEAYPESKYCERHMHRGRNRSRKPVEMTKNLSPVQPPTSITSSLSSNPSFPTSLQAQNQNGYYTNPINPFLYPHSSSSRHPGIGFSSQNNCTHLHLDPGTYCSADKDYRYLHGLKEGVDEHAFFSETSGTMRMNSLAQMKQKNNSELPSNFPQLQNLTDLSKQHCFVLGTDIKMESPVKVEREEEHQQPLRRFFDEWPPKNQESWLDLEEDRSFSTTQLSISTPNFFAANSRTGDRNDD
ncbi:growth-regulating factor 1-like [Tasmannia lanceolata]|uniref:growth-regulating factor 1-like n=1 Tax=Tasmannia lanceolata TaxID=3420 RepID=UPI004064382E